jgi:hypothetical protein
MAKTGKNDKSQTNAAKSSSSRQRRALLKKLGRFAAVSAPTVTLLLAAKAKPGLAQGASCAPQQSSRALKTRIGPVNGAALLAAIATLPIKAQ